MFGFLNCNKPVGFTSRDLVNVVQGRLRRQKIKVGHCGTLDPLAEGVLVVGVGPAAKLVPYVHETRKRYLGSFRLGAESPTGDLEIEPTVHDDHPRPTAGQIAAACGALEGVIRQTPPAYSAIKINGRRAYELARNGQDVDVPTREVVIASIHPVSYSYPDLELDITCSTGTYIRTLGMDLANSLGTVAVMTGLTRRAVGAFTLEESVSLEQLREQPLEQLIGPPVQGVTHLPQMRLTHEECRDLANGLGLDRRSGDDVVTADEGPLHVAALDCDDELFGILTLREGRWRPKRVFLAPKYQAVGDA